MKLLFIHQNYPGQYRQLVQWLAAQGEHEIVFLTQRQGVTSSSGIKVVRYDPHHRPAKDAYALSRYWEECAGAGYGAAQACQKLRDQGFTPDVILDGAS